MKSFLIAALLLTISPLQTSAQSVKKIEVSVYPQQDVGTVHFLRRGGFIKDCFEALGRLLCPSPLIIPDRDDPGSTRPATIVDLNQLICRERRNNCIAGCAGDGFGGVRCVEGCHERYPDNCNTSEDAAN